MKKAAAKENYVDGFLLSIPKKRLAEYKKMAKEAAAIWMKYGALDYKECVADDMKPKGMKTFFPKVIGAKRNEVVIFAYITYKSRAHRDSVNKKVMATMDKKAQEDCKDTKKMPFDWTRMAYGGFKVIVSS